jgi:Inorganic pyrophosphatase
VSGDRGADAERVWELLGRLFKTHPWHGVPAWEEAPQVVTVYVEIVPSDTVKYEVDKVTGHLKVDRPQRFSNVCPSLYGFTYKLAIDTGALGGGTRAAAVSARQTEVEIAGVYGRDEAREVIERGLADYRERFPDLKEQILATLRGTG